MNTNAGVTIRFIASLSEISAAYWNSLCLVDYPFVRYEFLSALEMSGSVTPEKGWRSQHLLVEQDNKLIAAAPLYVKSHSYGEYVFDWAWADAYGRYGLNYYPKLVTAIPFTPCTGARILFADETRQPELLPLIVDAIKKHIISIKASGWHCLFSEENLSTQLQEASVVTRIGCQFHWFNRNYRTWDDFVDTMNSRKRKNINKERRHVGTQGIRFILREGADTLPSDWQLFYEFYSNTYLKRSGHRGYLTQAFFELLAETFANSIVLVIAQHLDKPIAAALFFKDSKTIYGRYWGCLEEYDFLHFETCYYQGIEYAIKHRIDRFDGGAQGEHKIQRGFEPVITYSNHWLVSAEFQQAIESLVKQEAADIHNYCRNAQDHLPFKEI
jgi:uncharacterized protein